MYYAERGKNIPSSLSNDQTGFIIGVPIERCLQTCTCTSMRKEILIRLQPDSDKGRNKALKVAASVTGVESVTVTGAGKDLLLVIGDGVDAGKLTRKLQKEVGEAEIVELRTLPARTTNGVSKDAVVTLSPYQRYPTPVECPAAAAAAASRWQGEQQSRQAVGFYHRTPSPGYYQRYAPPSSPPMSGHGGYGYGYGYAAAGDGGSLYAREVARSHPANYSPMIARHDMGAADHNTPPRATAGGEAGRDHGGGGPNCCSIL